MPAPLKKIKQGLVAEGLLTVIRRGFLEFLTIPSIVIVGFIGLAYLTYNIDKAKLLGFENTRLFLKRHVFSDPQATSDLLGAIVGGIISVTTLTITLLLVVIQQSAGSFTTQVFDQFLRRKTNQLYFGFFIGLALYSMITLATVNDPFNPVWGGTLSLTFMIVALYLLVLLMYTTINQMRPTEIINAIHQRVLLAREQQLKMLAFTAPFSSAVEGEVLEIVSHRSGYLSFINAGKITSLLTKKYPGCKVRFPNAVGDYIACGDTVAELIGPGADKATEKLEKELLECLRFSVQRDIDKDPVYGLAQLETIAWTSTSTAKSNPGPGGFAIHCLRNIVGNWSCDEPESNSANPVILYNDNTIEKLMSSFESLAIVSGESRQQQMYTSILQTLSQMLSRVSADWQNRIEQIVLRIIPIMSYHTLTTAMEKELQLLIYNLKKEGKTNTAELLSKAYATMQTSVGKLREITWE